MDRNCRSDAESTGSEGMAYFFRFKESNGDWCDKLTDGEMTLRLKEDCTLHVNVKNEKYEIDESVESMQRPRN